MTLLRNPTGSRRGVVGMIALLAALTLLAGCAQTGQMVYMPRYDVLEPGELFADGSSAPALTARASKDDVIRARDGGFVGLASDY